MITQQLRNRYLAALGLSSGVLAACHSGEGGTTPDATATAAEVTLTSAPVESGSPTSVVRATATAAETSVAVATAATVSSWVPGEPPPSPQATNTPMLPPPRPLPTCPNGKFCLAETSAVGSSAAATPFGKCAESVPFEKFEPGARQQQRSVSFDKETTTRERSKTSDACCYRWYIPCPGGRPLIVDGAPRTAPATERAEWGLDGIAPGPPDPLLADHYSAEARFEHASVASFARVSLSLLSLGAPPELLAETHRAALDEIEHARAMFAVASAYRGAPVGPGPLDLSGALLSAVSLEDLAREAFWEGCVGEVAAALVLREEAALATSEQLRALLTRMAEDEERHAELAFRTVRWALTRAPAGVRATLLVARTELQAQLEAPRERTNANDEQRLPGVTSHGERELLRDRAMRDVVSPCLAALLA